MAAKNPQTHAKRNRELAVKEKRDRKRAKKAEKAAAAAEQAAQTALEGDTRDDESSAGPHDES